MSAARKKHISIFVAALIALTLAFIWYNSALSRDDSTNLSTGLLYKIAMLLEKLGISLDTGNDHWLRKLAHFGEFAVLGSELAIFSVINGRHSIQTASNCLFFGLAAAVIDETIQIFSARGSRVSDVWIDFSGVLIAVICVNLIYFLIKNNSDV